MKNKIKFVYDIVNNKYIQLSFIYFCLISFGSFIGFGDVIQNYGSRYRPPDFLLGTIIKGVGLTFMLLFIFFLSKRYTPVKLKKKK